MSIALADLIDPKQIALNLRAETQTEALREIVELLVAAGEIDHADKFLEQLRAREATNSTYAADGVAFQRALNLTSSEGDSAPGREFFSRFPLNCRCPIWKSCPEPDRPKQSHRLVPPPAGRLAFVLSLIAVAGETGLVLQDPY